MGMKPEYIHHVNEDAKASRMYLQGQAQVARQLLMGIDESFSRSGAYAQDELEMKAQVEERVNDLMASMPGISPEIIMTKMNPEPGIRREGLKGTIATTEGYIKRIEKHYKETTETAT